MKIQILGIGCPSCRRLETDVRELVRAWKVDAQVERVDDLEQILRFGLHALPGLVLDGQVVMCGYAGKPKLERLLREALETDPT
jgi:small redox-active disulfide protein 2